MMKHKWHDEIVAFAGGQKVEVKHRDQFNWNPVQNIADFASQDLNFTFRIKPQPKQPKYLYVWQELNWGKAYITASSNHSCAPAGHGYVGKIEVQDD
jgi:hypothetical protein